MQPWQSRSADFHPYTIDAIDALPAGLRAVAEAAMPAGERLVRGFVAPPDYRSPDGLSAPRAVPAQALLFLHGGVLHIQAAPPNADAPAPVFLQPEKLLWMRSSHLLLHGQLELVSAMQGEAVRLAMEFNALGWRLLPPEWHTLVARAIGMGTPATTEHVEEKYIFSEQETELLEQTPDKFAEGLGRYGLYTGEQLAGVVFQPALWKQNLLTFDEQLMPNTLVALTEASVLIIAEESALVRKSEQFGLIITRIPRNAITAVKSETAEPLQTVHFALERDGVSDQQSVLLTSEIAQAWLELWNRQL